MALDPEKPSADHVDLSTRSTSPGDSDSERKTVSNYVKIRNPLAGLSREELLQDVEAFALEKGLQDDLELLRHGGKFVLGVHEHRSK